MVILDKNKQTLFNNIYNMGEYYTPSEIIAAAYSGKKIAPELLIPACEKAGIDPNTIDFFRSEAQKQTKGLHGKEVRSATGGLNRSRR